MTSITFWTLSLVWVAFFMTNLTDGLRCYSCPKTVGETSSDANMKCLENSAEGTCADDEDRCFSLTSGASDTEVEKNCARSTDCVGRICCDSDFCNAGLGMVSQRGVGKVCDSVDDCVQGGIDMRCDFGHSSGVNMICSCVESVVTFGPICRKAEIKERCFTDVQCNDPSASCLNGRCTCQSSYFPNQTVCESKRPLGEACQADQQCLLSNSVCDGTHCVCQFGLLYSNSTNTCSGAVATTHLGHFMYGVFAVSLYPVLTLL